MINSQTNLFHEKMKFSMKVDDTKKLDSYDEQIAIEKKALDLLIENIKKNSDNQCEMKKHQPKETLKRLHSDIEFEQLFDPSMKFIQYFICHYWDSRDYFRKG